MVTDDNTNDDNDINGTLISVLLSCIMPAIVPSWMAGAPKVTTDKLQRVMNAAVRVIIRPRPIPIAAHWTALAQCARASDVQALHHGAQLPARSSTAVLGRPLPTMQSPTSLLGSISGPPVEDSWFFRVTGCKRTTDVGLRTAFSVAGLSAWNSLPDNLRDPSVSREM